MRFDPFIDLEYFAETLLKQKRLAFLRSVEECLATGRSSSALSSNCDIAAEEKISHSSAITMAFESVLNRLLGRVVGQPLQRSHFVGEFVPPAEGGQFGEVFVDATVGLPLIVAAVFERLDKAAPKEGTGAESSKTTRK